MNPIMAGNTGAGRDIRGLKEGIVKNGNRFEAA
jgi:hypothetical protein